MVWIVYQCDIHQLPYTVILPTSSYSLSVLTSHKMFLAISTLLFLATMLPPRLVDCNATYIIPDLQNDSCSQTQQPCYTLSQYPASRVQSSNIIFLFFARKLPPHLSYQLSIANISHLTLSVLDGNVIFHCLETYCIQQVHITNVDCIMNQMLSISFVTLIVRTFINMTAVTQC